MLFQILWLSMAVFSSAMLIKGGIAGVEVFGIELFLRETSDFAETLKMDDFPFPQIADRVDYIGVIGEAEDIVIGCAGFLFRCHIFCQIGKCIAL